MLHHFLSRCTSLTAASTNRSRRRAAINRLPQQGDILEVRRLLSAENPLPTFTILESHEGELFVEVDDSDNGGDLHVTVTVEGEDTPMYSRDMSTEQVDLFSMHGQIPPNSTKNVTVEVRETSTVSPEDGDQEPETLTVSQSLSVSGITLNAHEITFINGFSGVVTGEVDMSTPTPATVSVMYRESGETDWIKLTDVHESEDGIFVESFDPADDETDFQFATKTSIHGVDVIGEIETIENFPAYHGEDYDGSGDGTDGTSSGNGDDDDDDDDFWSDFPGV